MPTQNKIDNVKRLTLKIKDASAIYFTDYQGLNHKELENLRRKIKKVNGNYSIVKNSLFKIALTESKIINKSLNLSGPTAVLFANQDPIKPLQIFSKDFRDRLKAAIAFGEYLTGDLLQKLANLDSEEVLQTKLVANLAAPLSKLVCALNWNMSKLAIVVDQIRNNKGSGTKR